MRLSLWAISITSAPHNEDMKLPFPVKCRCFVPVTQGGTTSRMSPCQISETCSPFIKAKHLTSNVTAVWPAICCLAEGHRPWAQHQSVGQCGPFLPAFCSSNGSCMLLSELSTWRQPEEIDQISIAMSAEVTFYECFLGSEGPMEVQVVTHLV